MGIIKDHNGMFTANTVEWATPKDYFRELDSEFHFTLDPCSTDENALCKKHYTKEDDGLSKSWDEETVYCNPPYGTQIKYWVKKDSKSKATTVMLLPARTDTSWFHDYIYGKAEIRFLRGRLKFGNAKWSAPFPSMTVIFRNE